MMERPVIVVDSEIPFIEGVLDRYATVRYVEDDFITPEAVRDADGLIIRTRTKCNASLLDGSRVRFIATATIGMDQIDMEYCASHGIHVENSPGCNARGVLQWVSSVLAHMLGDSSPESHTLGIIGVGHVGSLVERYAREWGFDVVCSDPPRELREHCGFLPLEEVLSRADIVTVHTPLDPTTRHLVNVDNIGLLRQGSIFMNASRGPVVQTEALLRTPARLAIDVWEGEPNLNRELLRKAEYATSHIAGYSLQGKANATAMVVAAAARFFSLPIDGWYPPTVKPTVVREICWEEMRRDIDSYFDIERETAVLKSSPERFESLRNSYAYRTEFF